MGGQSPSLATLLMFTGSLCPSMAAVVVVLSLDGRAGLRAWLGLEGTHLVLSRCDDNTGSPTLHIALGGAIEPSPAVGTKP